MKAAIVSEAGRAPVYGDFKEPIPAAGESRIAVTAAALSPVVKARASGTHYSSSGGFPIGVGIDGVGRLDDGSRVHFFLPRAPYGSMAEKVVVPSSHCTIVSDGLDDIMAPRDNPGRRQRQSAESLLIAASKAAMDKPIRFIQIGTASGANISLSGALLRSTAIELKGSGLGSMPVQRIVRGIEEVLHAAVAGRFEMATKPVPLSEVEQAWSCDTYIPRIVFTLGE